MYQSIVRMLTVLVESQARTVSVCLPVFLCLPLCMPYTLSFQEVDKSFSSVARMVLVLMESLAGTGHKVVRVRPKAAEKMELLHHDPIGNF